MDYSFDNRSLNLQGVDETYRRHHHHGGGQHLSQSTPKQKINPVLLQVHYGLYQNLPEEELQTEITRLENGWDLKPAHSASEEDKFAQEYAVLAHLYKAKTGKDILKLHSFDGGQHFSFKHSKLLSKIEHAITQVVKTVVKVAEAAANVVANLEEDAIFVPILPFKPVMIKKLDKLGVSHSHLLTDIVPKFAQHMGDKSHFEERHNIIPGMESLRELLPGMEYMDAQHADASDAADQAISETGNKPISKMNIGEIIMMVLHFFEHLEGLPAVPAIPQRDDAQACIKDLHDKCKADSKNDTADVGVKGNLFGKKFDLQAFVSSPTKMIFALGTIIALFFFMHQFLADDKKKQS